MARQLLDTLTAQTRQDLVTRILSYLNDDIVDAHIHINHSGVDLLEGHRKYIAGLESFLISNGAQTFVPLPKWDPSTPIPTEFNVVKPSDDGTALPPLQNLNPNLPLPGAFQPENICGIPSAARLGNALNGWHGSVHVTVGGTMGNAIIASAAPIFWCWHAFIDDIYETWQTCTNRNVAISPELLADEIFEPTTLPSGNVSRKLFREWSQWSGNNLPLE